MKCTLQEIALVIQFQSISKLINAYLSTCTTMVVVWSATTGRETLRLCAKHPPAVLIISPSLQDLSSLEIIRSIRRKHPEVRILVFAGVLFKELVGQMLDAEVHGIVGAGSPLASLVKGINALLSGRSYFDGIADTLLQAPRNVCKLLTLREKSVLRLIAEGFSTKEVADELDIGVKTAEKFRERIMKKLDLHDAVKLTRYAIRNGITSLG